MQKGLDISDHYIHQVYSLLQWPNFPVFNGLGKKQNKTKHPSMNSQKQYNTHRRNIHNVLSSHLEKHTSHSAHYRLVFTFLSIQEKRQEILLTYKSFSPETKVYSIHCILW